MAASNQRRTRRYSTYGNVAYQLQPERDDPRRAVQRPGRDSQRGGKPRVQPRATPVSRPQVEVRPQGAVSLFAIVGFLAVAACALLLVMTSARLAVVRDETVELRTALTELEDEARSLRTEYEMAFDLAEIERQMTADGSMVKANPSQTVYLDLSERDNVVYYEAAQEGIVGLIRRTEEFLAGLLA